MSKKSGQLLAAFVIAIACFSSLANPSIQTALITLIGAIAFLSGIILAIVKD